MLIHRVFASTTLSQTDGLRKCTSIIFLPLEPARGNHKSSIYVCVGQRRTPYCLADASFVRKPLATSRVQAFLTHFPTYIDTCSCLCAFSVPSAALKQFRRCCARAACCHRSPSLCGQRLPGNPRPEAFSRPERLCQARFVPLVCAFG